MRKRGDAPLTERLWEELEARLSPEGLGLALRIVLATDGSKEAGAGVDFMNRLPLRSGTAVEIVTVLDAQDWEVPESLKGAEREWARRACETAKAALPAGLEFSQSTPRGAPAREIIAAAADLDADLIVLGSRGRGGLERLFLGSVAGNVARHAGRPVLVARPVSHDLRRVVLAVDESENATEAVRFVACLPLPAGSEVVVANVVRPYTPYGGAEFVAGLETMVAEVRRRQMDEAAALVQRAADQLRRCGKHVRTVVRQGDPAGEMLALAREEQADLVAAGARGVSLIQGLLVGSVADRVLREASCSVLLVH